MNGKCFSAFWILLFLRSSELAIGDDMVGDWSLELQSETPAWMSVKVQNDKPTVRFRLYVGSDGPHKDVVLKNGRLSFRLKQNKKATDSRRVEAAFVNGRLKGAVIRQQANGTVTRDEFTATKIPPLANDPPDLNRVRFGHPISLFNGKDLTGWKVHEADKKNGWNARDGLLINETPKTDFSATGAYANLRTEAVFEDFWLHVDFLIEEKRNSGIYLRGMYEAQVVDRDSRMQGIQGPGAIFGLIAPTHNAGKPGGGWQSYDLTLVDRHVTVVLNGETVIDNQPVQSPTAGAVFTDPMQPGPIYLQGDHTSVKYRNMYLAPVIKPNARH